MKHDIFCIVVGILITLTGGGGYLLGRNCAVQSAEQAKSQAQEEFRLRYGFGDVLPNRRSLKHRKNSGCDTVLGTYCL